MNTGTCSLNVWPEPRGWKPPKPLSPYRDEASPPVVTHNRFRYLSTKEEPGSVPPTRPTPTPFVALVPKTEVKREKQESFDDVCREFRDSNDSFEPPLGRPVPRRKRRSLAPSPQRASRGHPEPEVPAAAVPTRDDLSPARDVRPRAPSTAPPRDGLSPARGRLSRGPQEVPPASSNPTLSPSPSSPAPQAASTHPSHPHPGPKFSCVLPSFSTATSSSPSFFDSEEAQLNHQRTLRLAVTAVYTDTLPTHHTSSHTNTNPSADTDASANSNTDTTPPPPPKSAPPQDQLIPPPPPNYPPPPDAPPPLCYCACMATPNPSRLNRHRCPPSHRQPSHNSYPSPWRCPCCSPRTQEGATPSPRTTQPW